MRTLEDSVYFGPNMYSMGPAVRLRVDISHHDKAVADILKDLPDFMDELAKWTWDTDWFNSTLATDKPNLAELIAVLALDIQKRSGCELKETWQALPVEGQSDTFDILYTYDNDEVGIEAGEIAIDILTLIADRLESRRGSSELDDRFTDLAETFDDFLYFAERRALGPSTLSMIRAAEARNIPWFRMNDESLVQFGHGIHQKRIEATVTSNTSLIGSEIASDKSMTNQILTDLGLPVPQQAVVDNLRSAFRAADRIGYPVVTKPLDGNHGKGVSIDINSDDELEQGFEVAAQYGDDILIESYIKGFDHRLLVIDGKLVAAARRMPAHVVGDGKHTISELVDEVNSDPRRGVGHENLLTRIDLGAKAQKLMDNVGLTESSVPNEGQVVILADTANISTGGTAEDVTDVIHPDNREMAERAIKAVGLDVGGVDFLTEDITQSFRDVGGGVCEINAGPGFRMHVAPSTGKPRDIAGAVMDMLFPNNSDARVPSVALTGTNGKTTTARMTGHLLRMAGHHVGMTSTDAVYINGKLTVKGDMTGPMAAGMVLKDPSVDAAVLETARGGIVRRGLGYDQVDVGALLNLDSDHLGLGGIDTLDQLLQVKQTVVKVATQWAVINADDAYCKQAKSVVTAENGVCWVTMQPLTDELKAHQEAGGRIVALEPSNHETEEIIFYDGHHRIPLMKTHLIPATLEGKALFNVQNAMFAAGMVWCLNKSLDDIRHGLQSFDSNFSQTPGRMNIFDEHGFRVILDYGHNEAAVTAMVSTVERMKPKGRKVVVATCPGDRRDEDIEAVSRAIAGHFDHYFLYQEDNARGRDAGEVPKIISETLRNEGISKGDITICDVEPEAVQLALEQAVDRDLVMVFGENVSRSWKQIIYFGKDETE